MQIFCGSLSVITAPQNVLTPHISKTHLPIFFTESMWTRIELILKRSVKEKGSPPLWQKSNYSVNLKIY